VLYRLSNRYFVDAGGAQLLEQLLRCEEFAPLGLTLRPPLDAGAMSRLKEEQALLRHLLGCRLQLPARPRRG
jgi:hypothetical protein